MKKDILNNDMWRKNVDNDISEKVRLLMENIIGAIILFKDLYIILMQTSQHLHQLKEKNQDSHGLFIQIK